MLVSRGKNPSDFLRPDEKASVVEAIEAAEKLTSGEIRVHLEKKCPGGDPYYRGRDVFEDLGMTATALRNGVLIYLSIADRRVAVLGDRGITRESKRVSGTPSWRISSDDFAKGTILGP